MHFALATANWTVGKNNYTKIHLSR